MDDEDRRQAEYAAYFMDALWARRAARSGSGPTVKAEPAPVDQPPVARPPTMALPVEPPAATPGGGQPGAPPGLVGPPAPPQAADEEALEEVSSTSYYSTSEPGERSAPSTPKEATKEPQQSAKGKKAPKEPGTAAPRPAPRNKPRVVLTPNPDSGRRARVSRSRSPTVPPGTFRTDRPGDRAGLAPPGWLPQGSMYPSHTVQCPPGWWYPSLWPAQTLYAGQAGFSHLPETAAAAHQQHARQQPRPHQQRLRGSGPRHPGQGAEVERRPPRRCHLRSKEALAARAAKRAQHQAARARSDG